jgi:hypothetical protein
MTPCSLARDDLFFNENPYTERRKKRKLDRLNSSFLRNVRPTLGPPDIPLEPILHLEKILNDANRDYMSKICHMRSWQFFLLADKLG